MLASCRKSSDEIIKVIDKPEPQEYVISYMVGLVEDEQHHPVANASVRIQGNETLTDENGLFNFQSIKLNQKIDYLSIQKDEFFREVKSVLPIAGETQHFNVSLSQRLFTNSFEASQDAVYKFGTIYEVKIPKNSLSYPNGILFQKKYKVAPRRSTLTATGNCYLSNRSENKLLIDKSVFGIEIYDVETNKALVLNQNITVSCKVNKKLQGSYAMYQFHDTTQRCDKISDVSIDNGNFVFKTKELGEYIIANTADYKLTQGVMITANSSFNKLTFNTMRIVSNDQLVSQDRSSLTGRFKAYVPLSTNSQLELVDECYYIIESKSIMDDPSSNDIIYDFGQYASLYSIKGKTINCNTSSTSSVYVLCNMGDNNTVAYPCGSDGVFDIAYNGCSGARIFITAVDPSTKSKGAAIEISNKITNDININSCTNKIDGIVRYRFQNFDTSYNTCQVRILKSSNTLNEIFIFEYGQSGIASEKVILEKNVDPSGNVRWSITQSSLIGARYLFRELVDPPEFYEFIEAGKKYLECNIANLRIEDTSMPSVKFRADLIYYKALIK